MMECSKKSVQSCPESLEGKAAAAWASGAYGGVREHGQAARTPMAAFFNTPMDYSSGCSSARQGPRTVMMIMPWRRSALLCIRSRLAVRRLGEVVGLNSCLSCLGFEGAVGVVRPVSRSGCTRESSDGRKRSLRSLRAMSRRILSFNHRTARASNDRKRKTINDTSASMLMVTSRFWRSRRFLLGSGNGPTHSRIGLHVFHPVIIHDP